MQIQSDQSQSTGQTAANFKLMSVIANKNRGMYTSNLRSWKFSYVNVEHNTDDGWFMDCNCTDNVIERIDAGYTPATSYGGFRLYCPAGSSTGNVINNLYIKGTSMALQLDGSPGLVVKNLIHSITDASVTASNGYINGVNPGSYGIYVNSSENHLVEDGSIEKQIYINKGSLKTKSLELANSGSQVQLQSSSTLFAKDYDNVSGDNRTLFQYGSILPETTTRHTASGNAWKFDVTSSSANANNALSFEVGKVIVAASSLVTISVWMYRPNNDCIGQIRIQKNSEVGIDADIKATNSSASNSTWTQISATCTPTAAGVLTVFLEAYYDGGADYVIVDDMGVSQA